MTASVESTADAEGDGAAHELVLRCVDLVQEFKVRRAGGRAKGVVSALDHVSFEVNRGETLAIVGETGSGKSTLARTILGSPLPVSGKILRGPRGATGQHHSGRRGADQTATVQMIFQDPFSALDPKWTVEKILSEPLAARGEKNDLARRRKVASMLERVGLGVNNFIYRRPNELSGGQAQRIAIARALISSPDLVICDEPVTSLDVSIQAQILKLLFDLKEDLGLTYLLIAHDLAVVRALADRTVTMYLGRFCEVGPTSAIFNQPAHPYTSALLSAIPPRPGEQSVRERIRLIGEPPSPLAPPSGCRFRTRCPHAQEICEREEPKLRSVAGLHEVACHFPLTTGGN